MGTDAAGQGDASATLVAAAARLTGDVGLGASPGGRAHAKKFPAPSPQFANRNSAVTPFAAAVGEVFSRIAASSLSDVPLISLVSVSVELPSARRPTSGPIIGSLTKRTPSPRPLPAGAISPVPYHADSIFSVVPRVPVRRFPGTPCGKRNCVEVGVPVGVTRMTLKYSPNEAVRSIQSGSPAAAAWLIGIFSSMLHAYSSGGVATAGFHERTRTWYGSVAGFGTVYPAGV